MINIFAHGALARDASQKEVNGKFVLSFSLPSTRKVKDSEKTTWVKVESWSDVQPGILPYLKKGTYVAVSGQGEISQYEKADGTTGAELLVRNPNISLGGSRQGRGEDAPEEPASRPSGTRIAESLLGSSPDRVPF